MTGTLSRKEGGTNMSEKRYRIAGADSDLAREYSDVAKTLSIAGRNMSGLQKRRLQRKNVLLMKNVPARLKSINAISSSVKKNLSKTTV